VRVGTTGRTFYYMLLLLTSASAAAAGVWRVPLHRRLARARAFFGPCGPVWEGACQGGTAHTYGRDTRTAR
jgi:hypothetical protein